MCVTSSSSSSSSPSSSCSTLIVLVSFILVLLPLSVTSFDITKLLSQYPAYSSFSNYLAQTQLATVINARQTITVLAVDNSGLAPISGKPMDVIKKVLSFHVILDYFDVQKLQHLGNQTITVTTLFQDVGQAKGMQGFMKITDLSTGAVNFASASDTNGIGSNLIKAVVAQPYNISVVQISTVIMPSFLLANPSPAPVKVPVVSPVPVLVPVVSPVPVPVPVMSPVPVVTPVIVPVPVVSPVPVATPVPVPVVSPAPVMSPAPVVSPVPVAGPVPVPVLSPPSPGGASDAPGAAAADNNNNNNNNGNKPKSGVVTKFDFNRVLAILLTLCSSIYVVLLAMHV